MTVSTNGQLDYGVVLDEKYENDIAAWWREAVLGYEPPFELYDAEGNYLNGVEPSRDRVNEWHDHRRKFDELHSKLPVKIVNYCSGDHPMYILAVPDRGFSARRGYPEQVPGVLTVSESEERALLDFCKEHDIEFTDGPAWFLSSYWG
jgi:hypothetical protein